MAEDVHVLPETAVDMALSAARFDAAGHPVLAATLRFAVRQEVVNGGFSPKDAGRLIVNAAVTAEELELSDSYER